MSKEQGNRQNQTDARKLGTFGCNPILDTVSRTGPGKNLELGEIFLCLALSAANPIGRIFEFAYLSGRSVTSILSGPSRNVQLPEGS